MSRWMSYESQQIDVDGFIFQPDPEDPENKCLVKYVARMDPKGASLVPPVSLLYLTSL